MSTTTPMTMARLTTDAAGRYGDRPALRSKHDGEWTDTSFTQVAGNVEQLALGLIALGIQPGDRVCILADTQPDWSMASLAIWSAAAVLVTIYPSSSAEECEWVAGNSEATAVICGNAAQVAKIQQIRGSLPELAHVIVMQPAATAAPAIGLAELRNLGRNGDRAELRRRTEAVQPQDACMFIYTSGTTGRPKGCVLTHGGFAAVAAATRALNLAQDDDVVYLFLPLAHVFAQIVAIATFELGATTVYYGGDVKQIIAELAEVKPTYLPSVPRIFEKMYAAATAMRAAASAEEQAQFDRAVELGVEVRQLRQRGEPVSADQQAAFETADERLFTLVRQLFGGRVRYAICGAAPISPEVLKFFYACGVPVLEGYGMTETTGVATVNLPDAIRFGTVGRAIPGAAVRIAGDGEIEIGGDVTFREYWHNPEAMEEIFTADGWVRTGDLGELDADGFLKITGRKKDIIITAGGKNLTPANLENDLKQCRFISQAIMYGDRRPYPVVLITLDEEEIGPWAAQQGLPADMPALAVHEQVRGMIQAELDRANARYAQVEQIKRFVILDRDLSVETGELTPSLKVKRMVVHKQHAGLFDALYA
ncbi:MAG TPA: long-chain fatty acid--CoA ligase [Streptosporangiaceae bacterium]